MDDDGLETWRWRVHGRVQGVGFREGCLHAARALGLAGWVRNRLDGSVELLAQGDAAALQRLHDWLPQGVHAARVDRVERELLAAPQPRCSGFERHATG